MTPPPQTLVDYNAQYNKWVQDSPIATGSSNSCNADSKYSSPDILDGSTAENRLFDYYVCGAVDGGDNGKCRGLTWDQWNGIWGHCKHKSDDSDPHSSDPCINMALQDTPGVDSGSDSSEGKFLMGNSSDESDVFDPVTNSGCDGCTLNQRQQSSNDSWDELDGTWDKNAYDSGLSSAVLFSDDGDGVSDRCDNCRISGVQGMRPAYPVNKDYLLSINFESDGDQDETYHCPSGGIHTRELYCHLDGMPNAGDDGPGCGTGSDEGGLGLQGLARFCARNINDYRDTNVADCCLDITDESSRFKHCPRDYCVSTKVPYESLTTEEKAKCVPESDEDGNSYCRQINDSCNDFFKKKCTVDIFSDPDTEGSLHEKCSKWAHIMPNEFNSIADRVCNIPEDIDLTGDEHRAERIHIRSIFTNPLCRDYIKRNLPSYVDRLTRICEPAVRKDGEEWVKTSYGEDMENICPCYYPQEYNDWYKQENYEGEDQAASSMGLQVRPECYMPECQKTLLYDTSGRTGNCPSLQVCANEIALNVSVSGSGNIDTSEANVGTAVCNFSSVVEENNEVVTDLTSIEGPDERGGEEGSTSGRSGGSRKSGDNNTMLMVGGLVLCIIICIILFVVMSGGGEAAAGGE